MEASLSSSTVEVLGVVYVALMALFAVVAATFKGRNAILWTLGCLLFPPLLVVLLLRPATERAGKVACPRCDRWTAAERKKCQHCHHEMRLEHRGD